MVKKIKIYLIVFSILGNLLALNDEQIISAEIPPSAYLEILAEKSEKKTRRGAKLGSYFFAGFGLLFYQSSYFRDSTEFPGPGFGYAMEGNCPPKERKRMHSSQNYPVFTL